MPEQDNHDKQPLLSEYDNISKASIADPSVSSPDVRIELSATAHGNDHMCWYLTMISPVPVIL